MESLSAVLPITFIVMAISIFFVPMDLGKFVMFLVGAVMLILGMGFFQLGAEMAMTRSAKASAYRSLKPKPYGWLHSSAL